MASFYIDNDAPVLIARLLHREGHDAVHTRDLGHNRASDPEQLLLAAQRGAITVSVNAKDFTLLHRAWHCWAQAWNITREHGGILLIVHPPRLQPDQAVREIIALVETYHARRESLANTLHQWQPGPGWVRLP